MRVFENIIIAIALPPCHGVHIKYGCYDIDWIIHIQTHTLTYSMHKLNKNSSTTEINPNNYKDIVKHL